MRRISDGEIAVQVQGQNLGGIGGFVPRLLIQQRPGDASMDGYDETGNPVVAGDGERHHWQGQRPAVDLVFLPSRPPRPWVKRVRSCLPDASEQATKWFRWLA